MIPVATDAVLGVQVLVGDAHWGCHAMVHATAMIHTAAMHRVLLTTSLCCRRILGLVLVKGSGIIALGGVRTGCQNPTKGSDRYKGQHQKASSR